MMKAILYTFLCCLSLCLFSGCSDEDFGIMGDEFKPSVNFVSPQVQFFVEAKVPWMNYFYVDVPELGDVPDEGTEFDIYFPNDTKDFWPQLTVYVNSVLWAATPESSDENQLKEYRGYWGEMVMQREDGECKVSVSLLPDWRYLSKKIELEFINGEARSCLVLK